MAPRKKDKADSPKTNLTVDTEAANTRESRPDSTLLSAIFSSNSLKFENQVAAPKTDHDEDKMFDAIMGASSRKYDDQTARAPRRQPPHPRTTPPGLVADSTSAVEDEYETLRSITAQRGISEEKLVTIVDHVRDHGLISDSGEVQFDLAALEPQLETQVQARKKAPTLTNGDPTVKEIERSILCAQYGPEITSTSQILEVKPTAQAINLPETSSGHFLKPRATKYLQRPHKKLSFRTLKAKAHDPPCSAPSPGYFNKSIPQGNNQSIPSGNSDRSVTPTPDNYRKEQRSAYQIRPQSNNQTPPSGSSERSITPTPGRMLLASRNFNNSSDSALQRRDVEIFDYNNTTCRHANSNDGNYELIALKPSYFESSVRESNGTDNSESPQAIHQTWNSSITARSGAENQSSRSSDDPESPLRSLKYSSSAASPRNSFRPPGRSFGGEPQVSSLGKRQPHIGGSSIYGRSGPSTIANRSDDEDLSPALKSSPLWRDENRRVAPDSARIVAPSPHKSRATILNETQEHSPPTTSRLYPVFANMSAEGDAYHRAYNKPRLGHTDPSDFSEDPIREDPIRIPMARPEHLAAEALPPRTPPKCPDLPLPVYLKAAGLSTLAGLFEPEKSTIPRKNIGSGGTIPRKKIGSGGTRSSGATSAGGHPSAFIPKVSGIPGERNLDCSNLQAHMQAEQQLTAKLAYAHEKLVDLRRDTQTEIILRNVTDSNDEWNKHPNHNRVWYSKNLRCTTCSGNCMDCKAPCCVHNQDVQIKRDRVSLPEEKTMASKRLNEINMCLPTGIDLPTHIKCTSCGKFVCPSCFGLCPVFPCHERTCLKCSSKVRNACEYHGALDAAYNAPFE